MKGLTETIEKIRKDPKGYAIILGDLCEAITIDDKRFDVETAPDVKGSTPIRQYQKVTELLRPIAKKILYINDGNHDYHLCNKAGNLVRDVVCQTLDIPYGTYSTKFSVRDKANRVQFKIFTSHGFGSINSSADDPIRRKSNMRLSLKRKLAPKAADCVLMGMGHTHQLLVCRPDHGLYMDDDGRNIKQNYLTPGKINGSSYIHPDHRWIVNTGSFLKLYNLGTSGYAERFGYNPVELGFVRAEVRDYEIKKVDKMVV
jgi:hypothetical protein